MLQNIGYQFVFRKIPDVIAGAGIPEIGFGEIFFVRLIFRQIVFCYKKFREGSRIKNRSEKACVISVRDSSLFILILRNFRGSPGEEFSCGNSYAASHSG